MYALNEKVKNLVPYSPVVGTYPIRLDANESCFNASEALRAEFAEVMMQAAYNRYPDPSAGALCAAFAEYYGIDARYVTAGNGSDELISVIMNAFLLRGERMLTLTPDFSMYRFYGSLAEAECVEFPKDDMLKIDVDAVIATCRRENIRMLIFSNPCNPTSIGLDREAVRRLIRSVDALVVLDEAYMDFWDQSLLQEAPTYENLIVLRTCSKAFGMAALRLGFAVANDTLIRVLRAVKSPYNLNTVSQAAGAAAYRRKEEAKAAISRILASRDVLYAGCKALESQFPDRLAVLESVTNFVLIRTAEAKPIYEALLQKGIAVRLMKGCLRVTAGTEEEDRAVLSALESILKEGES